MNMNEITIRNNENNKAAVFVTVSDPTSLANVSIVDQSIMLNPGEGCKVKVSERQVLKVKVFENNEEEVEEDTDLENEEFFEDEIEDGD